LKNFSKQNFVHAVAKASNLQIDVAQIDGSAKQAKKNKLMLLATVQTSISHNFSANNAACTT